MTTEKLTRALEEVIRAVVAEEVIEEKLPSGVARQLHAVERGDTEEEREIRRICAQEYLTKREAARFLNVSTGHIDNLIADDQTFPVHRIGGKNVLPAPRGVDRVEPRAGSAAATAGELMGELIKRDSPRGLLVESGRCFPHGCNPEREQDNGSLSEGQETS